MQNESKQVRAALAQLLEYRFHDGRPRDRLCVLTTRRLTAWRIPFLRSAQMDAMWLDSKGICVPARLLTQELADLSSSLGLESA